MVASVLRCMGPPHDGNRSLVVSVDDDDDAIVVTEDTNQHARMDVSSSSHLFWDNYCTVN